METTALQFGAGTARWAHEKLTGKKVRVADEDQVGVEQCLRSKGMLPMEAEYTVKEDWLETSRGSEFRILKLQGANGREFERSASSFDVIA